MRNVIKGIEHLSCSDKLKHLGLLQLEKEKKTKWYDCDF